MISFNRVLTARTCLRPSPFWFICGIATVAFGVSSILALTATTGISKYLFALTSVTAASIVQKLVVPSLHTALFCHQRFVLSNAFELVFSDWSEGCLVLVAVLENKPSIATGLFTGFMACKHLLVNGICSIALGPRAQDNYTSLAYLIHTRLLIMGIVLVPIPTLAGLSDQGTDRKSFFVLSVVTAALLLLQSLNFLSLVCGLHSHHIKKPLSLSFSKQRDSLNDLNSIAASLKHESARFEAFTQIPTTEVNRHVAYRFQDHREAFISEIANIRMEVVTDSGHEVKGTATASTAALSVVLAAACILILISSLFLVKSLEADWMASEDAAVYAIAFSSVLSDFAAAFTGQRTIFYPSPGEGLGLATRRSAAQLMTVILPLGVLIGWLFKAKSLLLPFDAFYIAVWIVGLAIQTIGERWVAGTTLLLLFPLSLVRQFAP